METLTSTKIICTIGPATNHKSIVKTLIKEGVTIFRLNFSHGDKEEHLEVIKMLRQLSREMETVVTICLDTKGLEFRIEINNAAEINFKVGDTVTFSNKRLNEDIFIPVQKFSDIRIGQIFYMDDGFLEMEVTEIGNDVMKAKARSAHRLQNHKKTVFPGLTLQSNVDTDCDKRDIEFGIANDIDIIFASFVNSEDDLLQLRSYIKNDMIPLYAKIETLKGNKNITDILRIADGIMVARGDLGIETTYGELFKVQKELCAKAIEFEKPVICATQMLESMIHSSVPTRAEVSDIGNSVLDGYDALMLSEETAIGGDPVRAAVSMRRIITNAEKYTADRRSKSFKCRLIGHDTNVCLLMKIETMKELNYICKKKGAMPAFLHSSNKKLLSICNMFKGVYPLYSASDKEEDNAHYLKKKYGFIRVYNITYDEEFNAFSELRRL